MGYRVKPFTMKVRENSTQEFIDVGLLGSDVDADVIQLQEDVSKLKKQVEWVTPEQFGAVGDGVTSDTYALRACFAHGGNILIPKGKTYGFNGIVPVYSNSTIQFDGTLSALIAGDTCLEFYDRVTETPGYTGVHDVVISGSGIIDMHGDTISNGYATPLRIHHCKDIVIKGITIKNYSKYHAIEIGGSDGVVIDDVKFHGCFANGEDSTHEAIQVEAISEGGTGGAIPYDETISKNILIKDCYFGESEEGGGSFRAIGSHSNFNDPTWNKYYDNIQIIGCTFEKNTFSTVYFDSNVQNLFMAENKFINQKNSASIILLNHARDCVIERNHFINSYNSTIMLGPNTTPVDTNNKFERIIISNNYIYNYNTNQTSGVPGIWVRGVNNDCIITENILIYDPSVTNYPITVSGAYQGYSTNLCIQNNIINGKAISDQTIVHSDSASSLAEFLNKRITYFRNAISANGINHISGFRTYFIFGSRSGYYDIGSIVYFNETANRITMVSFPQPTNYRKVIVSQYNSGSTQHYQIELTALTE